MGKFGLISCLAIAMLISVYACAFDPTPDPSKNASGDVASPPGSESPSPSPDETTGDESLGTTTDAVITPASCSVTLNFCDRPSSPIGTDCTETGCSLAQARSICKSIVASRGCAVHCNAVTRNSAGTILETWRTTCGGTCCPEGNFCGTGGQCCDGVTCKPGCPC
jgi:hypothetical protein